MQPSLRSATPDDCAAIKTLMEAVVVATLPEIHHAATIENTQRNLDYWRLWPGRCVHLVAEGEGRTLGVVLVKDFWNLCSLFVEPKVQRQGIGRSLVRAAVVACRSQSQEPAILLNAAPDAVAFYRRQGFTSWSSMQKLPPGFQAMRYFHPQGTA